MKLDEVRKLDQAPSREERVVTRREEEVLQLIDDGVVLEDMGKPEEAADVYRRAIECDGLLADAYYNLSRLYERAGDRAAALRHLRSYSELVKIN